MDILPQVQDTIERFKMFQPGDVVIVGVSGGPDSVALLDLLWRLREHLPLSLHVAHLNHRFREEAAREAEFVRELAASYGLKGTVEEYDVPAYARERQLSAEVAAREIRYRFFTSVLKMTGAAKVALGHQADDQAETVLLNFLRGTGLTGLKGIPPVREPYVRPLIEVRRAAVESYCAFRGLKTCLDASNLQMVYFRNRIRHELIPLLEQDYNPAVVPALCRLAEVAREEDGFMAGEAVKAFDKAVVPAEGGLGLKIDSLAALPLAVARRLVRLAYKRVTGDVYELDFLHTGKVLQLLNQRTGQEAVLPYNVQAVRSREMLYLLHRREKETPDFIRPVTLPGTTTVPELSIVLEARLVDSGVDPKELPSNEALLDFDLLSPPLFARRRRPGDVFQPFGFPAPVKLKDFLIGQKVPRHCRDRLLIVEDALGIVWIAGLRVGSRAAVTPKTRRCLHLRTITQPS